MFGYITINKAEMKYGEYEIYHSFYCGLCKTLGKRYGMDGQVSISYDMTFLAMLLSSLYEPETTVGRCKCFLHPMEKLTMSTNEISDYVADMNVLLTIYKCEDDWKDEKKVFKHLYGNCLKSKTKKRQSELREKELLIRDVLNKLSEYEKENCQDLDMVSGLFGEIMSDILVYKDDEWAQTLSEIGYNLGKFIYIMDAYEDLERDIKKGNYNPLKSRCDDDGFNTEIQTILTTVMSECCKAFETLPLIENVEILRNILYSGIWERYDMVREKREKQVKH